MVPKVAIYDFTDCEGCEVKLVSIREKLLILEKRIDIVNWRLGQEDNKPGPFDLTIIEGTPITQHEVDLLKKLRQDSKVLIALGACATLGGIPAILDKKERAKWYKKIYGEEYKPRGIDALPLSAYVKVDFLIHGCPIDENELIRIFQELLAGKTPAYRGYSVCFECKQANNPCRIINGQPCLGPITQGGCGSICIKGGSPCYGCFGLRQEANVKGLVEVLQGLTDKKEIERYFTMFLSRAFDK
ncbi:MAG: cytochrome B [Parcubacteria group bacterium]|jgi:coenzyme F420-reducing hydrogenase gamma subunit|nr:cytochrome B [Parcubacteria group bacterium]|tara:strand:+ start:5248 stop:5979 length:732 start_codon:yes stop_codon:yes gene_type:complete